MPIKNFDEMAKKMFKPIQFIVDGKMYAVQKVTKEILTGLIHSGEVDDKDAAVVCTQLAKMAGVKADTFDKTDLRVVIAIIEYVTTEATKQVGEQGPKNPSEGEVKPT